MNINENNLKNNEFIVLSARLEEAETQLKKLIKKATKYGNQPIGYTVSEKFQLKRQIMRSGEDIGIRESVTINAYVVTVTGEAPRVGDYELVGVISFDGIGGDEQRVIDTVPDRKVDTRFRDSKKVCEHCNKTRNRNNLYIVEDNNKNQIQVGRSCLRDHLGIDNPQNIIKKFEFFKAIPEFFDELESGNVRSNLDWYIDELLITGMAAISEYGWMSKTKYNEMIELARHGEGHLPSIEPTYKYVEYAYHLGDSNQNVDYGEVVNKNASENWEKYKSEAELIKSFILNSTEDNNYFWNLKQLFEYSMVSRKRFGIVLSAIATYRGHLARELERTKYKEAQMNSKWMGEEKERIKNVEGEVVTAKWVNATQWGDVYLYKIITQEGDVVTWFSGSDKLQKNDKITFSATIKKLDEYEGVKQTIVSRLKVA